MFHEPEFPEFDYSYIYRNWIDKEDIWTPKQIDLCTYVILVEVDDTTASTLSHSIHPYPYNWLEMCFLTTGAPTYIDSEEYVPDLRRQGSVAVVLTGIGDECYGARLPQIYYHEFYSIWVKLLKYVFSENHPSFNGDKFLTYCQESLNATSIYNGID